MRDDLPAARPPGGTGLSDGASAADHEPGTAAAAAADADASSAPRRADAHVPALLRHAAAWSWRLLLVAVVVYLAFKALVALRLLVLPFIVALLLTALLQPLTRLLRRLGLPAVAAVLCTLLVALIVLAGLGVLIANQVQADYPRLQAEVLRSAHTVQAYLSGPPFRLKNIRIEQLSHKLVTYLSQHRALVEGTVLTGGRIFIETLAGLILTLFITYFLLKDSIEDGGSRIWRWLTSALRPDAKARADRAGQAAWQILGKYVHGTTVVAAIHAVIIGIALWILGVPLVVPLMVLAFLAAYVPLIGILVVGLLAIMVTLATKGWIFALILLAVFLAENQIDSHVLQPQVVGRQVRLHPLATIVVLAIGGIVAGIPGAVVAVPTAAVISGAWPYLRGAEPAVHDHPQRREPGHGAARWRRNKERGHVRIGP
jgi:predicted PurR-regulated permease PerM